MTLTDGWRCLGRSPSGAGSQGCLARLRHRSGIGPGRPSWPRRYATDMRHGRASSKHRKGSKMKVNASCMRSWYFPDSACRLGCSCHELTGLDPPVTCSSAPIMSLDNRYISALSPAESFVHPASVRASPQKTTPHPQNFRRRPPPFLGACDNTSKGRDHAKYLPA